MYTPQGDLVGTCCIWNFVESEVEFENSVEFVEFDAQILRFHGISQPWGKCNQISSMSWFPYDPQTRHRLTRPHLHTAVMFAF